MILMNKQSQFNILLELRDYAAIAFGLMIYAFGWTFFMLPFKITTGGVTGVAAIIFYATGIEMQISYFVINAVLLIFALKILGWKFCFKTIYAVFLMTFYLWVGQIICRNWNAFTILGDSQDFMACIIGAILCGVGIGICFINNGSTGGTDIIAAIINKYRDITFGRGIMYMDIIIISSCYFIFHDWRRVMFGFVTLFIIAYVLDYVVNSSRQSVQFFIFSKKYEEIAYSITHNQHRGVTILDGTGYYSQQPVKVIVCLAKKHDSLSIFRMIKQIDPDAFVSQSRVIGVYGKGFDRIKVKVK